jgi:hypothetical protein
MAENLLRIDMHADKIELWPPCPDVVAAVEPLKIGIYWRDDPHTWESVTVGNFIDENGETVQFIGPNLVFLRTAGNVVKEIHFAELATQDLHVKYDLVCKRAGSAGTLTVDPTIRIRQLGGG